MWFRVPFFLAAVATFAVLPTQALNAADIVSIEEHWELHVGGPETDRSAPQVTMVMSPQGNLDADFFVFTLNHRSIPDYVPGGMEIQQWDGETAVHAAQGEEQALLSHEDETIQWVQQLSIAEGQIHFEIKQGTSQSWGEFGGSSLKSSIATTLTGLNAYKPAVSLEESGIAYAGNRVSSLVLKKIVWTTSTGQSYEMVAPIDIDADLDP